MRLYSLWDETSEVGGRNSEKKKQIPPASHCRKQRLVVRMTDSALDGFMTEPKDLFTTAKESVAGGGGGVTPWREAQILAMADSWFGLWLNPLIFQVEISKHLHVKKY